jgi:hypothetical protein
MTQFLDVRLRPVGGTLSTTVAINQGTSINDYTGLAAADLVATIQGRHVLIGTHGFNVDRADGIANLSSWEAKLHLHQPSAFVGLLWPGDSAWAHGLDYPEEPRIANDAAKLVAPFIDQTLAAAASISFASHSLGARLVLRTVSLMSLPVRRVTLMAGAIDDNCLTKEFANGAAKIGEISVLASKQDRVLGSIFPLGNLLGGIIATGHPWWRAALGQSGPANPRPLNFQAPFQLPASWDFGHGDYLRVDHAPAPSIPIPADVPPEGSPRPAGGVAGWRAAWSAAFESSRFV